MLEKTIRLAKDAQVDFFFVGGSLLTNDLFSSTIKFVKDHCDIPVVIFPGSIMQISDAADAILLLSLISGRNAEMLIGKHVLAAPRLKTSSLEILPTGYMLIGNGEVTTVEYISNTLPIPRNKDDIAVCTAMAGEMLGLKLIYMDAGSGAVLPVPGSMISKVNETLNIPLIVGGGIRTAKQANEACVAGADIVVTGNVIEDDPDRLQEIAEAVHSI